MNVCRFTVTTYNADLFPNEVEIGRMPEFGPPRLPVLIHQVDGLRILLGTHDLDDFSKPDIQIERQPNGWVIFLHPVGGSDASGYVYILDDGRSFLLPENGVGPTPPTVALQPKDDVPGFTLSLINEDKPLIARYSKGSAVAVICDILDQAQEKKRSKDVAEYLVGAKLELRFGEGAVQPKNVNTPSLEQLADFRFGGAAFEVTTAASADRAHLNQIGEILTNTGLELWLLTRKRDREKWQNAVDAMYGDQANRVVVTDIETFVGQNTSEIGRFVPEDTRATLAALFSRYTNRWLPATGAGGLRIVDPEAYGE